MGCSYMAKTTTTYKSINEVTPAKIAPIDRIAAMNGDVQTTLASIGGAGNAPLAFNILRQIDALAAEICSPDFLAILDCTSKASGTGFSFALRFSKDGERKAGKAQRGIQKQWAGIASFSDGVPLLRERISKVHSTVMRKAALIE